MTIKEKALELYPVMLTDSDDWDIVEEQCDRERERQAFAKGANFIIETQSIGKQWSEEDDSILSDIVNHFDGFPLKHQTHEIFGWLVSIKQRIGG